MQTLIRRRLLWRLIWSCTVFQCPKCYSLGITDNSLSTALSRHSDKNSATINNRCLAMTEYTLLRRQRNNVGLDQNRQPTRRRNIFFLSSDFKIRQNLAARRRCRMETYLPLTVLTSSGLRAYQFCITKTRLYSFDPP